MTDQNTPSAPQPRFATGEETPGDFKVMVAGNGGAGYVKRVWAYHNETWAKLLARTGEVPEGHAGNYVITVNTKPITADQILEENQLVCIVPTNIKGNPPEFAAIACTCTRLA